MEIRHYLDRIEYSGETAPTYEVLSKLQYCHLMSVPFENLDIHYNRLIELDIVKLFEKIVLEKRGGFCYELNGLFVELLLKLGFNAKRVSARVFSENDGYGAAFDHLAILVDIAGMEYLVDVGFGEFSFSPLRLETGIVIQDARGDFIFEKYQDDYLRVSKLVNEVLVPKYIFRNIPRALAEFNQMCLYHQTSPASHFTQKRLISRPTPNGRISITGNTLKITEGNSIEETQLETEAAFRNCLLEYFDLSLGF